MPSEKRELTISWNALFRVVVVIFSAYLIWRLQSVFLVIFLAGMLAAALYPMVRFLSKYVSHTFASIFAVFLILMPLIFIASALISTFINELPGLLSTLNSIIGSTAFAPDLLRNIDLSTYSEAVAKYVWSSTPQITSFFTTALAIIFLTLYVLIDAHRIHTTMLGFLKKKMRPAMEDLVFDLMRINGHYIRGNLLISLVCGIIIYVGLASMNVPYAGLLSVFAAILDLLPLVGSIIGAVPAVILAFAISPALGLFVVVLFAIYQQFENNILAPAIYRKALDISPVISFISVIIGATLLGMVGAFLALPIAASIPRLVSFFDEEDINIEDRILD